MKVFNLIKVVIVVGILLVVLLANVGSDVAPVIIALAVVAVIVGALVSFAEKDDGDCNINDDENDSATLMMTEVHYQDMVNEQIRQQNEQMINEMVHQHNEFATNESVKSVTPFSQGGYDTSFDMAVHNNHSFFSHSFNDFSNFGNPGGFGF